MMLKSTRTGFLSSCAIGLIGAFICICWPLFPEANRGSNELPEFWENREAREAFAQHIFAPLSRLTGTLQRRYVQREKGGKVVFTIQPKGDGLFLLFVAEGENGAPSYEKQGNVSIKRSRENGEMLYMTVLLRDDARSFARIFPMQDRASLSVTLFGIPVYDNIKLPFRYSALLTAPFAKIMRFTRDIVDWDLVLFQGHQRSAIAKLVDTIRNRLGTLEDCDDGAYDSQGDPVFIATETASPGGMNCSGFAKWVMDGFYYPVKGRYMEIARLKTKLLSTRGNRWSRRFEDERDPFFGLDWTRNLAQLRHEITSSQTGDHAEMHDVRESSFAGYAEDVGFRVADLELLFFELARNRPDTFYLGSINRIFETGPYLRQHFHVVVIVPTFTARGRFEVVVFERNVETSLPSLLERYADDHIHLVAVSARGRFQPLSFD